MMKLLKNTSKIRTDQFVIKKIYFFLGNTYIVEYTFEKSSLWCRALVKDELQTGITKMYDVYFIDYGNSSLVPVVK